MVLFVKSVDKQLKTCEKLTSAIAEVLKSLPEMGQLGQDMTLFYDELPATVQAKLDRHKLLSCYRMFAPFTRVAENLVSNCDDPAVSVIAALPQSAMATHLVEVLFQEGKQHNSEALPDIKTLVQLVEHFRNDSLPLPVNAIEQSVAHQSLTNIEVAQEFVGKVLNEAKGLHDIEIVSLEQKIQLNSKSGDMRQSVAGLSQVLHDALRKSPDKAQFEHQTYASLLYLSGQYVVIKGEQLMFDSPIIVEDLNLAQGILAELNEVAKPEIEKLAKSVLQAQHKLSWHRSESFISHSLNHRQKINLDQDIAQLKLATQIAHNKVGYLSFMSERQSMCEVYHDDLVALISALPEGQGNGKFNEQLNVLLAEVKLERDANASLFSAINKVQKAEDILVIAGNHNKRLSVMIQELKAYVQETKGERTKINLQEYVALLPELRANNDEVRDLAEQKHILLEKVSKREAYLKDLYRDDLAQQLAEPKSPEIRAYHAETNQLEQVEKKLCVLDDRYQKGLFKLKKEIFKAQINGGYPDEERYRSADDWQIWVQAFMVSQLSQYRPSVKALILERQLAKNNMSNMGDAYLTLLSTVNDAKSSLNSMSAASSLVSPKEMISALGDLHHWSMVHPVEAIELAGDLTQAYSIIMANPGTFGQELVNTVKTEWQAGTVQDQEHDILNAAWDELADKANLSMTPEMIALLHTAQMAPYVVGGNKGAMNSCISGPILASVFTMMIPSVTMAAPVVGLIGGLLQMGSEPQLSNKIQDYRSAEVMDPLIKGMQSDGEFSARGRAVSSHMLQRQALQEVGSIARDSVAVENVGAMKRFISEPLNVWKHSTPGAKVFTVLFTVVVSVVFYLRYWTA